MCLSILLYDIYVFWCAPQLVHLTSSSRGLIACFVVVFFKDSSFDSWHPSQYFAGLVKENLTYLKAIIYSLSVLPGCVLEPLVAALSTRTPTAILIELAQTSHSEWSSNAVSDPDHLTEWGWNVLSGFICSPFILPSVDKELQGHGTNWIHLLELSGLSICTVWSFWIGYLQTGAFTVFSTGFLLIRSLNTYLTLMDPNFMLLSTGKGLQNVRLGFCI